MPWTEITRPHYVRDGLRYASDATDAEWALIEAWMPPPKRLGRKRKTKLRCIVDALLYILATGCQWRLLPKDFPPYSTVQGYFYRWREDGTLWRINHALVMAAREREDREASPSAGIIDSQSVKTTEMGGPRGYDAGKKINGRKRHILVDTCGFLIGLVVHRADVQDRDGAPWLIASIRHSHPWLRHVFADGGYAGKKLASALAASASGRSRSSNVAIKPRASSFCRAAGWSSVASPGSAAAAVWPRTSKRPSHPPKPGSCSPASASSPAASQDLERAHSILSQTLNCPLNHGG